MSAPVKNTCPDIDKGIKLIENAIKIISRRRMEIDSNSDEDDVLYDILYLIEDVPGILEDLRRDNSALRDWGHDLDKQLEESANIINELEVKLSQSS